VNMEIVSAKLSSEKNPDWTIYEAALMLDVYISNKEKHKSEIVQEVSYKLRKLAISCGYEIDDSYRNEKGISDRLESLLAAYRDETHSVPPTKLYKEIVKIYRTDKVKYHSILSEVYSVI